MKALILFFTLCVTAFSYSQVTTIYQLVEHSGSTASDGCISVRLEIDYTLDGFTYINVGPTVSLDEGNSVNLTANIPIARGVVINNKKIRIYGSNSTHLYIMQDAVYYDDYFNGGVHICASDPSNVIHESETVSPSKFTFGVDAILGGL